MKKRNYLYGLTAIIAAIVLLIWAFSPRPVPVELATASLGRFETSISEDGKTRVRDRYIISAPLSARVARINLREGDIVQANTVVASLTPALSPMLDTRTRQEQAARVETADAMLSRSTTRIELAKVALEQAQAELKRSEKLALERFVSANKLEVDRLAERAAKKELETAIEERHVATHELQQARAALSSFQQNPTAGAKHTFDIKTPIAGKVLRVIQPSENIIALGTPILEIGDIGNIEIVSELLTTDALQVKPGTPVRIDRWGGAQILNGVVRRVEPAAFTKVSALGVEEQRVNVLMDITSPLEQWQALGDGYRVNVNIITLAQDKVLRVPVSAIFPRSNTKDAKAMAAFINSDGRAKLVPVEVGARNGVEAWITSGLKEGDQVIIYPGDTVKDGAPIKARTVANTLPGN